jgi:hypothetical protein
MADTSQSGSCSGDTDAALLPNNPFEALHYHFGMLLGVDDLETEQGFHHGKMRLHNGWLHREGVVWGLAVQGDEEHQEIRVTRGLALDPAGHELHLDVDHCLNVPAWFAALPEAERSRWRAGVAVGEPFRVEAHVVIRHRACLSRQVPAMLEPCDGSGRDTAYSRVVETVDICLVPGRAPTPATAPYHRLRLLFGLDDVRARTDGTPEPDDTALVSARDGMLTKPRRERLAEALRLLRLSAAEDSAALAPPRSVEGDEWLLFPGTDDASVVLADVAMLLAPVGETAEMRTHDVDYTPRPAHVATRTIQELLAAAFFCCSGAGGAVPRPADDILGTPSTIPAVPALVPGEPRAAVEAAPAVFKSASVKVTAKRMVLATAQPLAAGSVTPKAFALHVIGPDQAWTAVRIETARYDPGKGTVTLAFREELTVPAGGAARLVASTGGATPLLAADFSPLAGGDFVFMHKGS